MYYNYYNYYRNCNYKNMFIVILFILIFLIIFDSPLHNFIANDSDEFHGDEDDCDCK